jgi:hypothetical protein
MRCSVGRSGFARDDGDNCEDCRPRFNDDNNNNDRSAATSDHRRIAATHHCGGTYELLSAHGRRELL